MVHDKVVVYDKVVVHMHHHLLMHTHTHTLSHTGDQYEHFLVSVLQMIGFPILSCTHEYITQSSKVRNKNAAARRAEKARLTRYRSQCHSRSNNSMRLHMSWWQRHLQFNGESTSHTGSKTNKSLGLGSTIHLHEGFDFTGWTLLLFDLNGTTLYRE